MNSWKAIKKRVKNEISKKLLAKNGPYCVYCERVLIGTGNQIDHFAHKALHSQFTFNPVNLFYSCSFCNSSARKGQKNTINNPVQFRYDLCQFKIVHPYFDNPDTEILYQDADKVFFDLPSCSNLGRDTIAFFKWDDIHMTMFRARTLKIERLNPLSPIEEQQLILSIISYK
ncbi:hypothetical protein ACFO3U_08295 [Flavobacterium ponti]|uniref:HNH endonuclease n=1 Tax=Flavobacterium ponti TaxID=665133 RepID=A0ABV9P311_9FLAO